MTTSRTSRTNRVWKFTHKDSGKRWFFGKNWWQAHEFCKRMKVSTGQQDNFCWYTKVGRNQLVLPDAVGIVDRGLLTGLTAVRELASGVWCGRPVAFDWAPVDEHASAYRTRCGEVRRRGDKPSYSSALASAPAHDFILQHLHRRDIPTDLIRSLPLSMQFSRPHYNFTEGSTFPELLKLLRFQMTL